MKNNFKIIIPARKNSQRLSSKNTKILCGKPLISYTIEYSINHFNANDIWVNTDDEKILEIAKKYNINIYERKPSLATNTTKISDVLIDQCNYFIKEDIYFEHIILLQPTNPFRDNYNINDIINYYLNNNIKSLMSVSQINRKIGKISEDKFIPINYKFGQRSQNIENYYYENGSIYICDKETILNKKNIISENVYPFITDGVESEIDIDYEEDFKSAELYINSKKNI